MFPGGFPVPGPDMAFDKDLLNERNTQQELNSCHSSCCFLFSGLSYELPELQMFGVDMVSLA